MLIVGALQPSKCFVHVTKRSIDDADSRRGDITLLSFGQKACQHLLRLGSSSSACIGDTQSTTGSTCESLALLVEGDGLVEESLFSESVGERRIQVGVGWIEVQSAFAFLDRLVQPPRDHISSVECVAD